MEVPTVREFSETFMSLHVESENKPSEVKAKRQILDGYLLPHFGDMRLNGIRPLDVVAFRAKMLKTGVGAKTINNRLKVLQKLLRCAVDWEVVPAVIPVKLGKVDQADAEFLRESQIEALLKVATEEPWRAMVRVALHTGLRIGELRALRWSDVDLGDKRLRVRQATWSWTTEIVTPKSRKPRTVPLNVIAEAALRGILRKGPLVFTIDGSLLGYTMCLNAMTRLLKAAGLKGDYGWHTLRHTFASHLAMRGEAIRTLQELLGHASISTTMRYAHLTPDVGHDAVAALNDLGQPKNTP